ncbi:MerR family transcriptional regulator [Mesobacterium pallidum]|uniref:MerR family transcriptional regulator n=1 Tax=Mesobacterium pallidum TaxID=2872037 RepID=UPI001EE15E5A|nr:helix-turn-helix domain-containing protein [Mesobacterium pallidum]
MFSIGELSRRTGVKVTTIRWYEGQGLIANDGRTEGGQRRYSRRGLERLGFIRHARDLGLPLEAIRALIGMEDGDHASAHAIARDHLEGVRDRIARLKRLEAELERIAGLCDGDGPCRVVEAFGDHAQCEGAHPAG